MRNLGIVLSLAGILALQGCASNTRFTSDDTSRLTKRNLVELTSPARLGEKREEVGYNFPQLNFEDKVKASREYVNVEKYYGKLYIGNNDTADPIHTQTYLDTTGAINNSLGSLKAIEATLDPKATNYNISLAPADEAGRKQLSGRSGLQGIDYFTTNDKTGVKVEVRENNKIANSGKGQDNYTITITLGEDTTTLNHDIKDTRTPIRAGAGAGIGFLIAGIPGAIVLPAIEGISYASDTIQSKKLPSNTRITQKTINAGLEGKVASTHQIIDNAKMYGAKEITIVQTENGTAAIYTQNAKPFIGPNKERNLKDNQVQFLTNKEGANQFVGLLYFAAQAGAIRIANTANESDNLNGTPFNTGTGGRIGGPAGGRGP